MYVCSMNTHIYKNITEKKNIYIYIFLGGWGGGGGGVKMKGIR